MSANAATQIQAAPIRQRTLWRDAVRSFTRNRLAMTGLVIVALLIFCAIFANFLAPDP